MDSQIAIVAFKAKPADMSRPFRPRIHPMNQLIKLRRYGINIADIIKRMVNPLLKE
jgi:hypothetical protein